MNLTVPTFAGLGVAMAIYSACLTYEGFIDTNYSNRLTVGFVDRPAAERAYAHLSPKASIAERVVAARRLVESDPANPAGWAANAYVDWLRDGNKMSPTATLALAHSYAAGIFDPHIAIWRTGFALENWQALSPELRRNALEEAKASLADPILEPELRTQLLSIKSPEGRVASLMILSSTPG